MCALKIRKFAAKNLTLAGLCLFQKGVAQDGIRTRV